MRQFAVNPQKYIEENSREFEEGFLNILRQRPANTFYSINSINNELVRDRNVPRLPSTKWPRMQHFLEDIEQRAIIETSEDSKHGFMVRFLSNSTGHPHKRQSVQRPVPDAQQTYLAEYHRQLNLQSKLLSQEFKAAETQEEKSVDELDDQPFSYSTFEIKSLHNNIHHFDGKQTRDSLDATELNGFLGKRMLTNDSDEATEKDDSKHPAAIESRVDEFLKTEEKVGDKEIKWICKNAVVQIMDKYRLVN